LITHVTVHDRCCNRHRETIVVIDLTSRRYCRNVPVARTIAAAGNVHITDLTPPHLIWPHLNWPHFICDWSQQRRIRSPHDARSCMAYTCDPITAHSSEI